MAENVIQIKSGTTINVIACAKMIIFEKKLSLESCYM